MPKLSKNANDYARLHLVCGERGSGKTQVCAALAQLLSLYGEELAGLISPGVFVEGRKTAIEAYDLRSQQRRQLAIPRTTPDEADATQPATRGWASRDWIFDESVLEWGDAVLRAAVPCGVLIVDELGPLEFVEGRGWMNGLAALDSRNYRMAVATIRPGLLERAAQRWPGAQVHEMDSTDDVQPVWTALSRAAAEGLTRQTHG
jgi:nucleoside-triphosphatase THEP1